MTPMQDVSIKFAANGRGFAQAGRKLWIFRPRRTYKARFIAAPRPARARLAQSHMLCAV